MAEILLKEPINSMAVETQPKPEASSETWQGQETSA